MTHVTNQNPLVEHYARAIREARAHLTPGPCDCVPVCEGAQIEWMEALRILDEALKPVGFVSMTAGKWEKMETRAS